MNAPSKQQSVDQHAQVVAEIRRLVAEGERTWALDIALDHGLRAEFVRGDFEAPWWQVPGKAR